MQRKHTIIAVLAASLLAAGGLAVAHPAGDHWHHGGGSEIGAILHGLNLTDAQKQQAKAIHQAAWKQAGPTVQQLHTLHEQLITQLLNPATSQADLQALVHQEELVRNKLDAAHLDAVLQVRALLTPAQLQQAAATHAKLAALHQQERAVLQSSPDGQE